MLSIYHISDQYVKSIFITHIIVFILIMLFAVGIVHLIFHNLQEPILGCIVKNNAKKRFLNERLHE